MWIRTCLSRNVLGGLMSHKHEPSPRHYHGHRSLSTVIPAEAPPGSWIWCVKQEYKSRARVGGFCTHTLNLKFRITRKTQRRAFHLHHYLTTSIHTKPPRPPSWHISRHHHLQSLKTCSISFSQHALRGRWRAIWPCPPSTPCGAVVPNRSSRTEIITTIKEERHQSQVNHGE